LNNYLEIESQFKALKEEFVLAIIENQKQYFMKEVMDLGYQEMPESILMGLNVNGVLQKKLQIQNQPTDIMSLDKLVNNKEQNSNNSKDKSKNDSKNDNTNNNDNSDNNSIIPEFEAKANDKRKQTYLNINNQPYSNTKSTLSNISNVSTSNQTINNKNSTNISNNISTSNSNTANTNTNNITNTTNTNNVITTNTITTQVPLPGVRIKRKYKRRNIVSKDDDNSNDDNYTYPKKKIYKGLNTSKNHSFNCFKDEFLSANNSNNNINSESKKDLEKVNIK